MTAAELPRTVRVTTDPGEAVRAGRLVNRQLFRLMALAPLIGFACGLAILVTLGWPEGAIDVVAIWGMSLVLLGFGLAMPALTARQAAGRYPELFVGETTVTIDDAGFHASKGQTEAHRGWSDVTDVIGNAEFLVVRYGKRPIAVIPKRAFADAADADAFEAALRHHIAMPARQAAAT